MSLLLLFRLAVLVVLFVLFLTLDRRGRPLGVVLVLLGIVLVDATLYADTTAAQERSIFHPQLFGQSFRLTQLAIPAALVARLVVTGLPRRFDASAPFWAAFFAWTLVAAVTGLLAGHDANLVLGEATAVIHVGGMALLAAGVPAADYVTGTMLPRFLQGAAALAGALFVVDLAGVRLSSSAVYDVPLVRVGAFGADAATLFSSLGVVALVLGLTRAPGLASRAPLLVPGAVLVLSHLASAQRAARLGLYATLVLVLVVAALPTARRRLAFTYRQVVVAAAALAAAGCLAVLVPAVTGAVAAQSIAVTADAGVLAPTSRQGSIDSRFNQWTVVLGQVQDHPLVGEGLGGTFRSFSEGKRTVVEGDISHNIALDVLRRTGVVGVTLAFAALLAVFAQSVAVWRFHPSTRVAGLAAAGAMVLVGLLAKGMVESILEKDRLAVLLGFVVGVTISASLSWARLGRPPDVWRLPVQAGASRAGGWARPG